MATGQTEKSRHETGGSEPGEVQPNGRPGQGSRLPWVGLNYGAGTWKMRRNKESGHPTHWPSERDLKVVGDDCILKSVSYSSKQRL